MAYATIIEDGIDVLVVGAGLGGTGAAWEARFWGQDKKIVIAEKANIDRSGAVAQGLYAINCYMGTRWGENKPEDHVRYARIDLMGMVREDLLFDMARHVARLSFGRDDSGDANPPPGRVRDPLGS